MAEYALIIALVAVALIGGLVMFSDGLSDMLQFSQILALNADSPSGMQLVMNMKDDFLERITEYYKENGRWPSSWGPQRFEQLGLDPADWTTPLNGLLWNPHGADVGLTNVPGDGIDIFVTDLNGNQRQLYDGHNIWCVAASGTCYYKNVAPGNEVDISTLVIVGP